MAIPGRVKASLNDGGNDFVNAALKLGVISDRTADCDLACDVWIDTAADQLGGIYQQPRGYPFLETVALKVPHLLADKHEVARSLLVDFAFVHQNIRFERGRRIVK